MLTQKKYTARLAAARKLTNQDDAVMIASGKLKGINVTVGAQNFSFIGGSVGSASGEAFICAVQHAIDNRMPFIFFRRIRRNSNAGISDQPSTNASDCISSKTNSKKKIYHIS